MESHSFCLNKLSYGSHSNEWDLSVFLYKGAVLENRRTILNSIKANKYGGVLRERIEFVSNLFEYFDYRITIGLSQRTIISELEKLFLFVRWCENENKYISKESIAECFIEWVNHGILVVKENKQDEYSAYKKYAVVANIIVSSQNLEKYPKTKSLLLRTNLKQSPQKKESNFIGESEVFAFGKLLKALVDQLTIEAIRGELSLLIKLPNKKNVYLKGNLMEVNLDYEKMRSQDKELALERRRALAENESLLDKYRRSNLINLRIEAELMIFISQTNMNLSQALDLKLTNFRWMIKDDEYHAFTVYKNRRQGKATFKCYKEYKDIFLRYLEWVKDVGFCEDGSLFPFMAREKLIAKETKRKLHVVRNFCKEIDFKYISSTPLRKFKANWLFENGDDTSNVFNLMSHQEGTFRKHYQIVKREKALKELSSFNSQNLKKLAIGLCSNNCENPQSIERESNTAQPDCVNPEGCLFCVYHKDVISYDYCFKLISHIHLKRLEMVLNPSLDNHPAKFLIERINQKIDRLKSLSETQEKWIAKAQMEVQSGVYHSDWIDYILFLEEMV